MDLPELEVVDGPLSIPPVTPEHTHGKHEATPSAREVIFAALAQPLPCPACGSITPCRCVRPDGQSKVDQQADLVEAALRMHGHLPEVEDEVEFDPEEVAMWLADRSGFIRYADEGWKRIIESAADVEVAAAYAFRVVPTSEVETVRAARAALLEWHRKRPAPEPEESV